MSAGSGPVVFSVGIDPGFKLTDEVFVGGDQARRPPNSSSQSISRL
jgi:hypothetical protein